MRRGRQRRGFMLAERRFITRLGLWQVAVDNQKKSNLKKNNWISTDNVKDEIVGIN